MARAMEHSLLARRLCFTLDIAHSAPNSALTILSGIRVCPLRPLGFEQSGGLTRLGLRLGDDLGLQCAPMRNEHARLDQALQFRIADAEFAEHRPVVLAL